MPRKAKTASLAIAQEGIEVRENKSKNGIEIYFLVEPPAACITYLREKGFCRSLTLGCWYAPIREDTTAIAYSLQLDQFQ